MVDADRDYFLARAQREREIAISCEDNAVALTHFRFAEEYERRAANPSRDYRFQHCSTTEPNLPG